MLDTTVLIAAERASAAIDAVIGDEDDVAIAAVRAAELMVGVELAQRRRHAGNQQPEQVLGRFKPRPWGCAPIDGALNATIPGFNPTLGASGRSRHLSW